MAVVVTSRVVKYIGPRCSAWQQQLSFSGDTLNQEHVISCVPRLISTASEPSVYENASSVWIISVFWFEENYEDADFERFLRLNLPL